MYRNSKGGECSESNNESRVTFELPLKTCFYLIFKSDKFFAFKTFSTDKFNFGPPKPEEISSIRYLQTKSSIHSIHSSFEFPNSKLNSNIFSKQTYLKSCLPENQDSGWKPRNFVAFCYRETKVSSLQVSYAHKHKKYLLLFHHFWILKSFLRNRQKNRIKLNQEFSQIYPLKVNALKWLNTYIQHAWFAQKIPLNGERYRI